MKGRLEQEHNPCWALSPVLGMRPGHQCSLLELSGISLWDAGILLLLLSSLGHPRAEIPRVGRVPDSWSGLLPSCCSSNPSPQLIPRLWAPPGLGRAKTSVRFQGSVLTMRRPSGPGSPAHRAAAAALSSVLPWERISEEKLVGH